MIEPDARLGPARDELEMLVDVSYLLSRHSTEQPTCIRCEAIMFVWRQSWKGFTSRGVEGIKWGDTEMRGDNGVEHDVIIRSLPGRGQSLNLIGANHGQ